MMLLSKYNACICEGSSEQAIIELLIEDGRLIFSYEDLLEEQVLRCRDAKTFEERYLRKGFDDKITVFRILDSRREKFRLRPVYADKVSVVNVITAPEIEMLLILSEGKYTDFKKKKQKPSDFCKTVLHHKDVKSYEFIRNYFADTEKLVAAIREYKRITQRHKDELTLADLLKD